MLVITEDISSSSFLPVALMEKIARIKKIIRASMSNDTDKPNISLIENHSNELVANLIVEVKLHSLRATIDLRRMSDDFYHFPTEYNAE